MNKYMLSRATSRLLVAVFLISTAVVLAGFEQQNREGYEDRLPVRIAAVPNDTSYGKQDYLRLIGAEAAWDVARENMNIKIAIVDTGVDLDHPDLKDNLVPGINLIDRRLPPRDDNGHGTQVAGILAAVTGNNRGVSGLLWKAQIMPIKALDPNGRGDEEKLVEAIRYAVDHGAKIVVLSVGLIADDPNLRNIVQYAEDRGVLLVAATGNDEGNVVRYPAGYPTVLAVGGVTEGKTIERRSNYGPEIDIVAPWTVFTTAIGGRYEIKDGTSMAAPQAAGVAALIWSKYPQMKPYEVRSHIRQTAEDLGEAGWDTYTGHGLIRADRALLQPYTADMYENNNTRKNAKPFPINRMLSATLSSGTDMDWFYVDSPYDGTLKLMLDRDDPGAAKVRIEVFNGNSEDHSSYYPATREPFVIAVSKGRTYLRISSLNSQDQKSQAYRLTSEFRIYRDPFEDNDRIYRAYALPPRSQTLVGTFDVLDDEDWFVFRAERSGTLSLKLDVDTARIDPVLMVQRKSEKAIVHDQRGAGEPEITTPFDVLPGEYYIRVTNLNGTSVPGEYSLDIDFSERLIDPNEPNDRSFQAAMVAFDYAYSGVFDFDQDTDWFQFRLEQESYVDISLTDIPAGRTVSMTLSDSSFVRKSSAANTWNGSSAGIQTPLPQGTYYLKLNADAAFTNQMYRLLVRASPLVAGFMDIHDHWARDHLTRLAQQGIIQGDGSYRFNPDRRLTRAEAAAMIVRGFRYSKQEPVSFRDMSGEHWAYSVVSTATHAAIVGGYPDGTFRPDEPVTRMEMTAMLSRALKLDGKLRGTQPFTDIAENHWGLGILKQMKAEGWISGYPDGSFRPDQPATRAEFSAMLARALP
jgi:serine protease